MTGGVFSRASPWTLRRVEARREHRGNAGDEAHHRYDEADAGEQQRDHATAATLRRHNGIKITVYDIYHKCVNALCKGMRPSLGPQPMA
jgi:hypothetical protein